MERRGLGRGLEALISIEQVKESDKITLLNTKTIKPNRYQPRQAIAEDKLQELIASVKEKGLVQPIIVRQNSAEEYELIAGERRLRAVKALGQEQISAVIKNVSDLELLEYSLIENIQRQDLNPLEEAKAYESLTEQFGFTQEQIARSMGRDRATVANMLRLLTLPEPIKDALTKNAISLGHAKAILGLPDKKRQLELLDKIIKHKLSVREAEHKTSASTKHSSPKRRATKDQHILELESELQHILGTKVCIIHAKKRGKIQIEYYSLNDLERVLALLRKSRQASVS